MKATVLVRPKEGILDPQGEAVETSLAPPRLRGRGRARRHASSTSRSTRPTRPTARAAGRADVRAAAREPADRELRDRDRRLSARSRGSPSSSSRGRTTTATRSGRSRALGAEAVLVWHEERELPDARRGRPPRRLLVRRLPPLRRDRPLLAGDGAVRAFADAGGLVLGICNGFQILCEAGLLPGRAAPERVALVRLPRRRAPRRAGRHAVHRRAATPGQRLVIPVKHGEGCWFAPPELVAELEATGQIVLRYARARTRTARSPTSPASATSAATSWA